MYAAVLAYMDSHFLQGTRTTRPCLTGYPVPYISMDQDPWIGLSSGHPLILIQKFKSNYNSRVVCPNFGHPVLTSSFTKYTFFQVNIFFVTIVNRPLALKLFQLSNGDLLLLLLLVLVSCLYKVRKPRMPK